jgi:hypothetical protein
MIYENLKTPVFVVISVFVCSACYYFGQESMANALSNNQYEVTETDTTYTSTDTVISIDLKLKNK